MSSAIETMQQRVPAPATADATAARPGGWRGLYKLGTVAALAIVLVYVLDIAISFGGGDTRPGKLAAVEWFALIEENTLLALRTLGLLNIIALTLAVPLYVALYATHRNSARGAATFALIVYLLGTAVYISNNAAVPMFVLSGKYAAATTDAQRTLLAAAGEAVLARGQDFTAGSFIGFFFTEIAAIIISVVMLRGKVFSRASAATGLVGFALLATFTVWATFIPVWYSAALIFAAVGGLTSLAWYLLLARRLFQLRG